MKPWRDRHEISFVEERKIVWEKVGRREDDLDMFAMGEMFIEYWGKYRALMREYLDKRANRAKWVERRKVLDKVAEMIEGDDRKAFMMLDFYRMECSNFCAEKMIRKYGGSFGWTRYEWMVHWYNHLGMQKNSQLQRWIEKGRFGGSTD